MDYLKTQAPFWKKERSPTEIAGSTRASATTRRWRAGASPPATPIRPAARRRRADALAPDGRGLGRGRRRRAPALGRGAVAERALERLSARDAVRQLCRRPRPSARCCSGSSVRPTSWFASSLVTGLLGGFTTFSSFSVESLILPGAASSPSRSGHTMAHVVRRARLRRDRLSRRRRTLFFPIDQERTARGQLERRGRRAHLFRNRRNPCESTS